MTASKIYENSKKSISKFSLALLIVVISFASVSVTNEVLETELADICRNKVSLNSAYEPKHRKCFVASTPPNASNHEGQLSWLEAARACEQLPHLEHFGLPTLATIDLSHEEMTKFLKHKMPAGTCDRHWHSGRFWTGGYIPFRYMHEDKKDDNEWRWKADFSRLSVSHPAWGPEVPRKDKPLFGCALFTCGQYFYLFDTKCYKPRQMLCQYEADKPEVCPWPPEPKLGSVVMKDKTEFEWGYAVTIRCCSWCVIEGTKYERNQLISCRHGKWTTPRDCVSIYKI